MARKLDENVDKEHIRIEDADYWCKELNVDRKSLEHALKVGGSDRPDDVRRFLGTTPQTDENDGD